MSKKIKYITLIIIAAALVVILMLNSDMNVLTSPEENPVDLVQEKEAENIEPDQIADDDEDEVKEAEKKEASNADVAEEIGFSYTENPFKVYNEALANGKPIVIKFYSDT
ncbi:MAG: hypothetical protein SCJ94_07585 [Bacillota bacterium]|nr:hypothetical protein [Bacillota bacterium]MDW7729855.1 hypothetical protein [Bacillota bacterium]